MVLLGRVGLADVGEPLLEVGLVFRERHVVEQQLQLLRVALDGLGRHVVDAHELHLRVREFLFVALLRLALVDLVQPLALVRVGSHDFAQQLGPVALEQREQAQRVLPHVVVHEAFLDALVTPVLEVVDLHGFVVADLERREFEVSHERFETLELHEIFEFEFLVVADAALVLLDLAHLFLLGLERAGRSNYVGLQCLLDLAVI